MICIYVSVMYLYIHTFMYTYVRRFAPGIVSPTCMCRHICMKCVYNDYVFLSVYRCVHACVCVYLHCIYDCTCMLRVCTCACVCTHVGVHVHIHICMHMMQAVHYLVAVCVSACACGRLHSFTK